VKIRESHPGEIPAISALIAEHSFQPDGSGTLLPVSAEKVGQILADQRLGCFFSAVTGSGDVVGCVSVVIYGLPGQYQELLAKLRSRLPLKGLLPPHFRVLDTSKFTNTNRVVAELRSLAVHSSYRGHGVGLSLIQTVKAEAKERGFKELYSLVNQASLSLFARAGFTRTDRTPQKLLVDCASCPILKRCTEVPVVARL
jgi:N-acetylglutamate synthase-like GNAT family acetyltransferase